MAKTKHNKALARTIVGLGTLWAGAAIWASISGQTQPVSATVGETSLIDPLVEVSASAKLDDPLVTPSALPAAPNVAPATTAALSTPIAQATATTPAATLIIPPPSVSATTPANTSTVVAPVPTTLTPKAAATPTVTPKPLTAPIPKIRTRGS